MKGMVVMVLSTILSVPLFADQGQKYQAIVDKHFQQYSDQEHFTALQVSIKVGNTIDTIVHGKVSNLKDSELLNKNHLFKIGSITKSFTAVLALKAALHNQLQLDKPVGEYLKTYPHWKDLSLRSLLNMTSGLPLLIRSTMP